MGRGGNWGAKFRSMKNCMFRFANPTAMVISICFCISFLAFSRVSVISVLHALVGEADLLGVVIDLLQSWEGCVLRFLGELHR